MKLVIELEPDKQKRLLLKAFNHASRMWDKHESAAARHNNLALKWNRRMNNIRDQLLKLSFSEPIGWTGYHW